MQFTLVIKSKCVNSGNRDDICGKLKFTNNDTNFTTNDTHFTKQYT